MHTKILIISHKREEKRWKSSILECRKAFVPSRSSSGRGAQAATNLNDDSKQNNINMKKLLSLTLIACLAAISFTRTVKPQDLFRAN